MFETTRRDGVIQARREGARWLSTVWDGGFCEADAVYNVAEEGRLVIEKPMHVRGVGWANPTKWHTNTSGRIFYGTVIKNLENPKEDLGQEKSRRTAAIEAPTVEISVPTPLASNTRRNTTTRAVTRRRVSARSCHSPIRPRTPTSAHLPNRVVAPPAGTLPVGHPG